LAREEVGVKRKNEAIERNGLLGLFWRLERGALKIWEIVLESHRRVEVL